MVENSDGKVPMSIYNLNIHQNSCREAFTSPPHFLCRHDYAQSRSWTAWFFRSMAFFLLFFVVLLSASMVYSQNINKNNFEFVSTKSPLSKITIPQSSRKEKSEIKRLLTVRMIHGDDLYVGSKPLFGICCLIIALIRGCIYL